jgi:ATP-dependent helicase HepA
MDWKIGDLLTHRLNPDLGVGRVRACEARAVVVEFPRENARLRIADPSVLAAVDLGPGRRVRVVSRGVEVAVAGPGGDGRLRLADGSEEPLSNLWPLALEGLLLERLARGELDPLEDVAIRFDALHLLERREAKGLGSFLGGRIRLFPHQLHVALRASAAEPVRWLLADEVGLGKTIEACLVLNRLHGTGRAERVLIVAPATLTVQWLGELWRKHHQVFTLLDDERLDDVAKDFGRDWNPFDLHRRAVIALETLVARPKLTQQAVAAGIDLLVVDEAQRLRRPKGHPGEAAWRAVAPIAGLGRHVLLLSATPLEDDAFGFFRLLQLLRPEEFPEDMDFEARLASGEALPPCTSQTRRVDIGGLPPRRGVPIAIPPAAWAERLALERALRAEDAPNALVRRRKAERVERALCSGAALLPRLGREEGALRAQAAAADERDPRLQWLAEQLPEWKAAGEKTLVFVAHDETLEWLRTALGHRTGLATAAFHEGLTPQRRDIEVARFREAAGPSVLFSTECGGEGRNFEFCRRLVLFDLPWSPSVVEQRVGRLDRIGRRVDVEIVYFVPPAGLGAAVAGIHEALGVFREPLAGIEPQMADVEPALARLAEAGDATLSAGQLATLVASAQEARSRIREAAFQQLHRERYDAAAGPALLARVPADLGSLHEEVVTALCERLGLNVEEPAGPESAKHAIELGAEALVDSLPGVPGGASFLGTFDREEAVREEGLDFFATGHPLVEGLLAHLEDSPMGRVGALRLAMGAERGLGLVALYKEGPAFELLALDGQGRARADWAATLRRRPLRSRRVDPDVVGTPEWEAALRKLGARLDPRRSPVALLALIVGP